MLSLGWGAVLNGHPAAGRWGTMTATMHINAQEMIAVCKGLLSFHNLIKDWTVHVRLDNIMTVAHINNMSSRIPLLSQILNGFKSDQALMAILASCPPIENQRYAHLQHYTSTRAGLP